MPQLSYTLDCPPEPFNVQRCAGTTEQVYAAAPITVAWHGASASVIAPGTVASPGAVDTSADLYLVVATVGSAALTLVRLADAMATDMETIMAGASWGIVAELTAEGVHRHQQVVGSALGLSPGSTVNTQITNLLTQITTLVSQVNTIIQLFSGGIKGDILRHNGTDWEKYHIGNQSDVLTTDTGLPVWEPNTGGGGGVGSGAGVSSFRTLDLWNGSGNNAAPAGWQTPGFDDSTWALPAAVPIPGFHQDIPPGSIRVWPSVVAHDNQDVLIRQRLTLPSTPIASASFAYQVASAGTVDIIHELWINGSSVPGIVQQQPNTIPYLTIPVAGSFFTPGVENVLAWSLTNIKGPGSWLAYTITFS